MENRYIRAVLRELGCRYLGRLAGGKRFHYDTFLVMDRTLMIYAPGPSACRVYCQETKANAYMSTRDSRALVEAEIFRILG